MKRSLLFAALLLGFPSYAKAQQPVHDPLAAEALFNEARELMKKDDFAHACPKLEASERLDPGTGTLLNLADCLEKAGKTASAWLRFREAASAALSAGQDAREVIARERAAALEPKLWRLVLHVSADSHDLTIERDGAVLDPAAWGLAIPVDLGVHTLRVSAPGKLAWTTEIVITPSVDGNGGERALEIPVLRDAPTVPSPAHEAVTVPPSSISSSVPTGYTAAALVAAGVAVASIGVGTWLALDAKQTYADAKSRCDVGGCSGDAQALGRSAGSKADAASVAFVIGAAALVGSAATWLFAPRLPRRSVGVAVVPRGTDLRGALLLLEGTGF